MNEFDRAVTDHLRRQVSKYGLAAWAYLDQNALGIRDQDQVLGGFEDPATLLDLLAEPVTVDGEAIWVRSSVGIATAAAGSVDAGELLHRADVAMYRAKDAGKMRLEGKEYVVKDGDVMHFRFAN